MKRTRARALSILIAALGVSQGSAEARLAEPPVANTLAERIAVAREQLSGTVGETERDSAEPGRPVVQWYNWGDWPNYWRKWRDWRNW